MPEEIEAAVSGLCVAVQSSFLVPKDAKSDAPTLAVFHLVVRTEDHESKVVELLFDNLDQAANLLTTLLSAVIQTKLKTGDIDVIQVQDNRRN